MFTKRIIPCLDVKNGRTVKGVNFESLRDAGDAVELAVRYSEEGADELVFLDITATNEKRKTMTELVRKVAAAINIPFTVGGGISTEEDVAVLLDNGADKISVNTAAFQNPQLVENLAKRFGSQCVVVAIDTKKCQASLHPAGTKLSDETSSLSGGTLSLARSDWYVFLNGGKVPTSTLTFDWAKKTVDLGAGEILLTSMNNDGTKNGFALDITQKISESVNVPVIASGGAGTMEHFYDVFTKGKADAALAASIFHFGEIGIRQLKKYLGERNIPVRIGSSGNGKLGD